MSRWKSLAAAFSSLLAVMTVSIFALVQLAAVNIDAASTPVLSTFTSTPRVNELRSFSDAQADLQTRNIKLSATPIITYDHASWNKTTERLDLAASMLAEEVAKYRPESLRATGLRTIYLVDHLKVDAQIRGGMPEPIFEDALYLNIGNVYLESEGGRYFRRTFHHELHHLMTYNIYGSYAPADTAWENCHAAGFRYGRGGHSMQHDPEFAHARRPVEGFINGYATSSIDEDKAEMFAHMMTDPERVQEDARADAGIACKLSLTRQFIDEWL